MEKCKNWTKEDRKRQIKIDETIRVYEDDKLLVVIPKTIHSACLYGKGTTWCFSSENERQMVLDGRMEQMGCNSTFDEYNENDVIYIFIMKQEFDFKGRNRKYCFQFEDGRFHNEKSEDREFSTFINKFPDLKELLKTHVKNNIYRKYTYPFLHLEFIKGHDLMKTEKFENPFKI